MDIKRRALELLGMSGISEEERMKRSLDAANEHPEEPMNPDNPSFLQKLRDMYLPTQPEENVTGPGVKLDATKVRKFKGK